MIQRPPIRSADNAVKTAAHLSAAQIKSRVADKAKQAAAKNAEKTAQHVAVWPVAMRGRWLKT